jgi:hypothetical protein
MGYLTGGAGEYTISSVSFNGGNRELGKDLTGGIAVKLHKYSCLVGTSNIDGIS